jgi:NAD(P)-dependent dehydrogenase (short-subunit alcohol dehydrogenase family)
MNVLESLRLDGKVALVTGAGSGIGRAYAEAVAEAGADVACLDWHGDTCEETAALVEKAGRRAIAIEADVKDEAGLRAAFDRAEAELGPLTIAYANAGVAGGGDYGDITDTTLETWNHVIGVNLTGVFLTLRESVRKMRPQGYGKIISTASIYGYVGAWTGGSFAYTAAKGGVVNLTRTLAVSLADSGIRVNAIAPGFVRTNLGRDAGLSVSEEEREARMQETAARIPMGAFAVPDDLKGLAVFLASPASDYCTGFTYPIDGGWLAS